MCNEIEGSITERQNVIFIANILTFLMQKLTI